MKKTFTFLIICFILNAGFCINQAISADTYIHITEEGIIGTESIQQDGKYYKFTETIRRPIVIEINDIILDGVGHRMELTYSEDGIMITGQSGITIQNIRITTAKVGIILRDASECIIKNNTVKRGKYEGIILMEASTFNTISGNTITGNGGEGIYIIEDSDSNTIVGNTLTENDSDEIYIEGSSNQTIYGNIVIGGQGEGIETGNSKNNKIFLNTVTQSHSAIQIKGPGPNNLIFKNMLIQNDYGIRVDRSNDNRIYENEIVFNEFSGIDVDFCTNNHFYNNEIYYNARGIDFFQSEQNFVYNNNFVENINQASFDPEINIWYFDYTIGGNYWSDYEGADEDNNGFGDEPKVLRSFTIDYKVEIDEENLDKMPLMQPKQINASKEPSSITCVVSPDSVTEGATITISGELSRAYDYPIPNEETEITLTIEKPSRLPDSRTFIVIYSIHYNRIRWCKLYSLKFK